jgi:hypothetical protein
MQRPIVWTGIAGALFASTWAAPALALCTNDVDCPTATCGGEVCEWPAHTCMPAGTSAQGSDGWCTTDTDCKCMGEGATCQAASSHCTFTLPSDGGVAATDAEVSGSSSSGAVTGSSGGYSSGGATGSSSGSGMTGGGSSSGEVLPDADVSSGSTSSTNSGGCSIGATKSAPSGWATGLACLACAAAIGRVRRRSR